MPAIQPREYAQDVTRYYTLPAEDAADIEKILHVYIYDSGQQTNCCEITPSYYCEYLYTSIHFRDGVSDERRNDLQERYAHEHDGNDECVYIHCRDLDANTRTVPLPAWEYREDAADNEDDSYAAVWEEVTEHAQCNWYLD